MKRHRMIIRTLLAMSGFLIVFNLVFITLVMAEGEVFEKLRAIVSDYLAGYHTFVLLGVLLVFFIWFLIRRMPLRWLIFQVVIVILFFFVSLNIALFPEVNRNQRQSGGWHFVRKNNATLEEAAVKSPSRIGRESKNYLMLNEYLNSKRIFIPDRSLLTKDYNFLAFITAKSIRLKDYDHRISAVMFKEIRSGSVHCFDASHKIKDIRTYCVVENASGSEEFFLYIYDRTYIFTPPGYLEALREKE